MKKHPTIKQDINTDRSTNAKQRERDELENQTQAFLATGGTITRCEPGYTDRSSESREVKL